MFPLLVVGAMAVAGDDTVVGAGAAGGGYELHLNRQMDRIEGELANGTITQEEFNIWKDQIERDSLLQ